MDGNGRDKLLMRKIKNYIRDNGEYSLRLLEIKDWLRYDLGFEIVVLEPTKLMWCIRTAGKAFKAWWGWYHINRRLYEYRTINNEGILNTILDNYYKSLRDFIQYKVENPDVPQDEYISLLKTQFNKLVFPITGDQQRSKYDKMDYYLPDGSLYSASIPTSLLMLNLNVVALSTIMNWWCFSLHVNLSALSLERRTCHRRADTFNPPVAVTNNVQHRPQRSYFAKSISSESLNNMINNIMILSETSPLQNVIKIIFHLIQEDVLEAPPIFEVPGCFQKSMTNGQYVYSRCLYNNTIERPHLHQAVEPRYKLFIEDVTDTPMAIARVNQQFLNNVYIYCNQCLVEFSGIDMVNDVRQHFMFCHKDEGCWQCPRCQKWFPMISLAEERWRHDCNPVLRPHGHVADVHCQLKRNHVKKMGPQPQAGGSK